ncbi:hypothetical protein KP509_23G054500 [Ceratopteris richardii]|uniref:Peptidase metallopeptidase domain-containing protein n=1 Tax=Ceratopteris richardii TaxID=49495 RepID=A0A8T2S267_CERRI|nr:hypothetical protein KP509_23G054500 [Ceratopteris richardii]
MVSAGKNKLASAFYEMRGYIVVILVFTALSMAVPLRAVTLNPGALPAALQIPNSLENFVAGVWSQFSVLLDAGIGDAKDAIVPLKRYFSHFGYLNLSGTNATEIFDTDLLSAVKLYQQSFRLEVSGKLDLKTLTKIMTPRCGREDVADGVPLMLQTTSVSHMASGYHSVGHYSFFPSHPTWPSSQRNLTYAFSPFNETGRMSLEERKLAFSNAFNQWAAVIPMNFTEIDDYEIADVKIEFVSYSHGDGEPFDGVLGVLAHAFSPTDGRFHLDDSEYWKSLASKSMTELQDIDLQSVVTHEIGHLIGLAHSPVEDAIMYPSIAPGQTKLQLQLDDIQGAQALYGVNPNYKPDNSMAHTSSVVERHCWALKVNIRMPLCHNWFHVSTYISIYLMFLYF